MERVYDDPTGELYEGEHGDDLDHDIWKYEQDEGEDTSREALERFAELAQQDGDAVFYGDEALLDTPSFLSYLAAESLTGQFDGYRSSHNYFIYHEPEVDEWTWLPWSLDQTFSREIGPYDSGGFMARKCIDTDNCRHDYIPHALDAVDIYESLDLADEIDDVLYVIDYAAHLDDHKRHSNDKMESTRKSVANYVEDRPAELREMLDCFVDGVEPDDDGDGWGACYHDCQDDDDTINPDAEEVCNGIDDDCSGFADDVPECPCPSEEIDGTEFYFCTHGLNWVKARDFCEDAGLELARFDTKAQNDEVYATAKDHAGGLWAFGLNDREEENEYRWIDGSEPAFTNWASGEPAHTLDWFDCVYFAGDGKWAEKNCTERGSFVCSEP